MTWWPRISDKIVCRLAVKFHGVLYRKLSSEQGFRENRFSYSHSLLKSINKFLPVLYIIRDLWVKCGLGDFHVVHLSSCGSHYTALRGVNEHFLHLSPDFGIYLVQEIAHKKVFSDCHFLENLCSETYFKEGVIKSSARFLSILVCGVREKRSSWGRIFRTGVCKITFTRELWNSVSLSELV